MSSSPRNIFIGGTGRSGTTILYDLFRDHPEIYAFPQEMRLLTDGAGIIPLIHHLSSGFTQARSRDAIARFERLMKYDLVHPDRSPYRHYKFKRLFNDEYDSMLDTFLGAISLGKFKAKTVQGNYEENYYWNGTYTRWRKRKSFSLDYQDDSTHVARYFPDRKQLIELCHGYVDKLFSSKMSEEGKLAWCEKTPANANNFIQLRELFPEAVLIHIKRDPRGVCQSYMKQDWAPSDLGLTIQLLEQRYRRWKDIHSIIADDPYFVEVKLEDLASDPERILSRLSSLVGTEKEFSSIETLDSKKVDYWKEELSQEQLTEMNDKLAEIIIEMGYEI